MQRQKVIASLIVSVRADPNDASKDERNLGDILDGSVAAIGNKRDNRQEFFGRRCQ